VGKPPVAVGRQWTVGRAGSGPPVCPQSVDRGCAHIHRWMTSVDHPAAGRPVDRIWTTDGVPRVWTPRGPGIVWRNEPSAPGGPLDRTDRCHRTVPHGTLRGPRDASLSAPAASGAPTGMRGAHGNARRPRECAAPTETPGREQPGRRQREGDDSGGDPGGDSPTGGGGGCLPVSCAPAPVEGEAARPAPLLARSAGCTDSGPCPCPCHTTRRGIPSLCVPGHVSLSTRGHVLWTSDREAHGDPSARPGPDPRQAERTHPHPVHRERPPARCNRAPAGRLVTVGGGPRSVRTRQSDARGPAGRLRTPGRGAGPGGPGHARWVRARGGRRPRQAPAVPGDAGAALPACPCRKRQPFLMRLVSSVTWL
jgi:hypothetical protein